MAFIVSSKRHCNGIGVKEIAKVSKRHQWDWNARPLDRPGKSHALTPEPDRPKLTGS